MVPPPPRRPPPPKLPAGGRAPPAQTPPLSARRIAFSFAYWRQTDGFGVGDGTADTAWFVALLEKLGSYSTQEIDAFRENIAAQRAARYHAVKWEQEGMELRRKDLHWVPQTYRDNDQEYPFYQFEVTTALGRFAGFWDEHDTFQIVLLDRLHNLQPAKKHNYTTRKTRVIESPHASLLAELDAISKGCGSIAAA